MPGLIRKIILLFFLLFSLQALPPSAAAEETAQQKADEENWFGVKTPLDLARGNFVLLRYPARLAHPGDLPRALVIFGSGCRGWSDFERRVSHQLQTFGCEVLGLDFALYAKTDYGLDTLERDYRTIVQFGLAPYAPNAPPPVILGGWSTGAEQAVAVTAGPHPPPGVTGLFLIAPGGEGGYGTWATSYFILTAPADKMFKLADLAPRVSGVRVAQWHAAYDPFDSLAWLAGLKAPHREFDFPNAVHDYRGACDEFMAQIDGSIAWILADPAAR